MACSSAARLEGLSVSQLLDYKSALSPQTGSFKHVFLEDQTHLLARHGALPSYHSSPHLNDALSCYYENENSCKISPYDHAQYIRNYHGT